MLTRITYSFTQYYIHALAKTYCQTSWSTTVQYTLSKSVYKDVNPKHHLRDKMPDIHKPFAQLTVTAGLMPRPSYLELNIALQLPGTSERRLVPRTEAKYPL